jgi:hypothetical protein
MGWERVGFRGKPDQQTGNGQKLGWSAAGRLLGSKPLPDMFATLFDRAGCRNRILRIKNMIFRNAPGWQAQPDAAACPDD